MSRLALASPCLLAGAFALVVPACSGRGSAGAPNGQLGAPCAEDADCESGSCWSDASFPAGYCTQDCAESECGDGASCQHYLGRELCLDRCGGDEECREGYVCDYGTCRPLCTRSEACASQDQCQNGRCVPPCGGDADCPEQQRCEQGQCLPTCKTDKECIPGKICNTQTGRCVPKPGKKIGEACVAAAECSTSHCLPTRKVCSARCTSSAGCPSGYACAVERVDKDGNGTYEAVEADCVMSPGTGRAGAACSDDSGCLSAHCYGGFCLEACAKDADCGVNQCVEINVLLSGGSPRFKGCLPRQGTSSFVIAPAATSGSIMGLDVPPTATSLLLTLEIPSLTEIPFLERLTDPAGRVLAEIRDQCWEFALPIRPYLAEAMTTVYLPLTRKLRLSSTALADPVRGVYSFMVGSTASPPVPITVRGQLKLGRAEKGTLNLNWFFLDLSGISCWSYPLLNAASAPSHPWMAKVRSGMASVLKAAGLTLGKETYQDLKNSALDTLTLGSGAVSPELQQLFMSSRGMQGKSVDIFLVRKIEQNDGGTFSILGIAGGIPGAIGVHGTVRSGLAVSMQVSCLEGSAIEAGPIVSHELGHYLGLSHNLEAPNVPGNSGIQSAHCRCPCDVNLTCQSSGTQSWCRGQDPLPDTKETGKENLMYYGQESATQPFGATLTMSQIRVLLDNPLVGF